jgi:hypothetical protein
MRRIWSMARAAFAIQTEMFTSPFSCPVAHTPIVALHRETESPIERSLAMGSHGAVTVAKSIVIAALAGSVLLLSGCGLIQWFVDAIENIAGRKTVEVRIPGERYLEFDKKDDGDRYVSSDGYLCVVHDPGCGVRGNDGTDKFFTVDKSALPLLVKRVRTDFTPHWPSGLGQGSSGSTGGYGSYGMKLLDQPPSAADPIGVEWNNTCVGDFNSKKLYYSISFVVSMPEGYDMGEPTFELSKTSPCVPPEVTKFEADPSDYIPIGDSTTLVWEIANCGTNCNVSLEAHEGLGYSDLAFKKNGLPSSSTLEVTPSQTNTRYTLVAKGEVWSDSRTVEVAWQPAQPSCPNCGVYFFMVTSATINPCFTEAVYAPEEASGQAILEGKHGKGYSVEPISEQEYYDGCE